MAKNFYDILGVSKNATDNEIKRAYRKQAHKFHPDKSGGDEAKFKELNEAYQVLSDKSKRAQYDQFGQTFNQTGGFGSAGGGFDFSGFQRGSQDFSFEFGGGGFEDIFSDIFGGGSSRSRRRSRGKDIQVDIEISFKDMVYGVEREIKLYKNTECDRCAGEGGEPGTEEKTCPTCGGSGQIKKTTRSFFGNFAQVVECSDCHGAGSVLKEKCKKCDGEGKIRRDEIIKIKVPAGIQDGQTISMQGYGEAGGRGSIPGDLYVNVHVQSDRRFARKGQDILSTQAIPFSMAVLGGKIEIETVEGNLILKIPAGTKSGEIFRIKEKGVPELQGRGRGHHLVTVVVETPKNLSREQKDLIEKLKNYGI